MTAHTKEQSTVAKMDPSYTTGWHTTGTLKKMPDIDQIVETLHSCKGAKVELHGLNTDQPEGWFAYDAAWRTEDGTRIRGRLNLFDQHPREERTEPAIHPRDYNAEAEPKSGFFHAYADAGKPWDPSWPSPLAMFVPRKLRPSYASVEYGRRNLIAKVEVKSLTALINALAELPWLAVVLTHDDQSMSEMLHGGDPVDMPLITRLPPSMYGRVVDLRIVGDVVRDPVNKAISRYGIQLPEGGAAIILPPGRRRGLARTELEFPMGKPFVKGGDISPLASSLSKMMTLGVFGVDPEAMAELNKGWTLLTDAELLDQASEDITRLAAEVADLKMAVSLSEAAIENLKEQNELLIGAATGSEEDRREALEAWAKDREELERLRRDLSESGVEEAIRAREAAEEGAEIAEALLDEQTHVMTALRQENAHLRRELARLGSTFTTPPAPEQKEPKTWAELIEQSKSLKHVVLTSPESGIKKLRGHESEGVWIRRSWEALLAMEEYAQMKKERGTEEVPHFSSYLDDPLAEHVIPSTRYSNTESKSVMMNERFVAARTLPVPRQVNSSGTVLMEAHIRIGSGKPPAPRMHFHDDTNGPTGKIYVGHLGPHLPNYQTN